MEAWVYAAYRHVGIELQVVIGVEEFGPDLEVIGVAYDATPIATDFGGYSVCLSG
jgi:hypothetical protein